MNAMLKEYGVDFKLEQRISREFIDLERTLSAQHESSEKKTGEFSPRVSDSLPSSPSSKGPHLNSHASVNSDDKFNEIVHSWAQNLLDDKEA